LRHFCSFGLIFVVDPGLVVDPGDSGTRNRPQNPDRPRKWDVWDQRGGRGKAFLVDPRAFGNAGHRGAVGPALGELGRRRLPADAVADLDSIGG